MPSSSSDILLLRQEISSLNRQITVANENIETMKRAILNVKDEIEDKRRLALHHVNNVTHMRQVADVVDLNEFATSHRLEKQAKQALESAMVQLKMANSNLATSIQFAAASERKLARKKAELETFGQVRYLIVAK